MPTARHPKSNDVVEEAHIHNRSGGQLYRCFYSGLERMGGQEAAYRVGDRVDNDGVTVGRMAILRCIVVRFHGVVYNDEEGQGNFQTEQNAFTRELLVPQHLQSS
jgi:hypothetical protein